jgi:hypothetical protein
MTASKPFFTIRALQEGDIPFLFSSYLKSYRPYFNHLGNDAYYSLHHERMSQFLEKGAIGAVAVASDDPDVILGWVLLQVTEDTVVVFYSYVKHAFRSLKLATTMLEQLMQVLPSQRIVLLHQTPGGVKLAERFKRANGIQYNPYWLELHNKQGS